MSKIFKRIFKDIADFKKGTLNESGIYCHFSEKNIRKVKVLIIGPEGTPYEGGFYLFNLEFSDNYPLNPPKVQLVTYGPERSPIRFNPNLYINGKVCLSILGTWSGPGWTVCCTLSTVLVSIQSLLNEYPIHNEPGWESIPNNDNRVKDYNSVLRFANYRVAMIDTLMNIPDGFNEFRDVMIHYLRKHENNIRKYIETSDNEIAYLKSSMFNLKIKHDLYKLKDDLDFILNYYRDITCNLGEDKYEVEHVTEKKISKRKVPNGSASKYDFGYEKISENDDNLYIVSKTKYTNKKRWKLKDK